MKWFLNLKIFHKIIILIIITMLFELLTVAATYSHSIESKEKMGDIYNNHLLSVLRLNYASALTRGIEANIYEFVLIKDKSRKAKLVIDTELKAKKVLNLISEYEKSELVAFEKKRVKRLHELKEEIRTVYRNILKMKKANKTAEALRYFRENQSKLDDFALLLRELADFNEKFALEVKNEHAKDTDFFNKFVFINVLMGLAVSFGAGLIVSKAISAPIYNVVQELKKDSCGLPDLKEIGNNSKHEIHDLKLALNDIIKNIRRMLEREVFLRNIITMSITSNDIKGVLNTIVTETGKFYNADICFFNKYDTIEQNFTDYIEDYMEYLKPGLIGKISCIKHDRKKFDIFREIIIENRQTFFADNVNTAELPEITKTFLRECNIKSFAIAPVFYEETPLGALFVNYTKSNKNFSEEEINLLESSANQSAIVIYQAKLNTDIEAMRRNFTITLTHDLRSPIFAEQKVLEMLMNSLPDETVKNCREYFEDMYKTNEELLEIINNLLSVYHYESGKAELKVKEESIEKLVNCSARVLKPLVKDRQCEIKIEIEENLPLVYINKREVCRLVTNLVSNAIKHTQKGTKITISAKKQDNDILVSINDNGRGIPEAEQRHIFEKYPAQKRKIGAGLGLYLSKQIVEAHKGKIWFVSEAGKGTTFYFTIPISLPV